MKYVYIKENLGWRSIILWDMIMMILLVSSFFPNEFPSLFYAEWHVAYRILLGFSAGILFLTLCCIKYIGILFQIAATVFWTILFSEIFENFDFYKNDVAWQRVITIFIFLLFFCLHWNEISALAINTPIIFSKHKSSKAEEFEPYPVYNQYSICNPQEPEAVLSNSLPKTEDTLDNEKNIPDTFPLESIHPFKYIPTPYDRNQEFHNMKHDIWGDYSKSSKEKDWTKVFYSSKNNLTKLEEKGFLSAYGKEHLLKIATGMYGEQFVEQELKRLNMNNAICFHNLIFEHSQAFSIEFDFLLLTQKAVFIIESKYRSNKELIFDGMNYKQDNETYENPVCQLARQEQYIRNVLDTLNIDIPIIPFVVFSNKNNIIKIYDNVPESISQNICKVDVLNKFIIDRFNCLSNSKLSYDVLMDIAKALSDRYFSPLLDTDNTIIENSDAPIPGYLQMKAEYYGKNVPNPEVHAHCKHGYMIPRKRSDSDIFFLICPRAKQGAHEACDTKSLPPKE